MVSDSLKELAAARAKVAELEQKITAELQTELRTLPVRYGFDSADAFVAAVRAASGKRRGRKPGSGKAAAGSTSAPKRRKRAKITDETRVEVRKLADAGKTGNEIARALGISLPSVQNIKKALGLVKKRK